MSKIVKIKVKTDSGDSALKAEKKPKSLAFSLDEGHPWEEVKPHHLIERELDLDDWLDQTTQAIIEQNQAQPRPEAKTVFISEPATTVSVTIKSIQKEETEKEEKSSLSEEKQRAVEEMFLIERETITRPFNHAGSAEKNTEKVASPIIMIWLILKERVVYSWGQKITDFLAKGWWLVVVWLLGELWFLSKQPIWHLAQGWWWAIGFLWPIICWGVISWLRSTYVITHKEFLLQLWPVALLTSLLAVALEVFFFSGAWLWLNVISLPLFILGLVAAGAWCLVRLGRLANN